MNEKIKEELVAEELYAHMTENFPDYPCKKCAKSNKMQCAMAVRKTNGCLAYELWFKYTWREIRNALKRSGNEKA